MRKTIAILFLSVMIPLLAEAKGRDFGAGIIIGETSGISGKYWISDKYALDGEFSVRDGDKLYLHGDYLWHDYKAFPKPEEGTLPLYYGGGLRVSGSDFGIRGVIGIEYLFADYPFDLFIELAPVINLTEKTGLYFYGGFGGRYYFGTGK